MFSIPQRLGKGEVPGNLHKFRIAHWDQDPAVVFWTAPAERSGDGAFECCGLIG
jgi:hypothetical protein